MFPTICQIGPITIHSYGLMMAVAVLVCAALMSRDAQKFKIESEMIYDLFFWVVLGGIIGARFFYVFLKFDYFVSNPGQIIMIQEGGLAWQGGLLFGAVTALYYIKKKSLPLRATLDLAAPYIALGQSIGRVGCFLNGCCYGREVAWGIFFPVHEAYLHPTQLYMSGSLLLIFFILKNAQHYSKLPGETFVLYLILSAAQRFIIEFFRADHFTTFLGLSIFQFICIGIFSAGLILFIAIRRRTDH